MEPFAFGAPLLGMGLDLPHSHSHSIPSPRSRLTLTPAAATAGTGAGSDIGLFDATGVTPSLSRATPSAAGADVDWNDMAFDSMATPILGGTLKTEPLPLSTTSYPQPHSQAQAQASSFYRSAQPTAAPPPLQHSVYGSAQPQAMLNQSSQLQLPFQAKRQLPAAPQQPSPFTSAASADLPLPGLGLSLGVQLPPQGLSPDSSAGSGVSPISMAYDLPSPAADLLTTASPLPLDTPLLSLPPTPAPTTGAFGSLPLPLPLPPLSTLPALPPISLLPPPPPLLPLQNTTKPSPFVHTPAPTTKASATKSKAAPAPKAAPKGKRKSSVLDAPTAAVAPAIVQVPAMPPVKSTLPVPPSSAVSPAATTATAAPATVAAMATAPLKPKPVLTSSVLLNSPVTTATVVAAPSSAVAMAAYQSYAASAAAASSLSPLSVSSGSPLATAALALAAAAPAPTRVPTKTEDDSRSHGSSGSGSGSSKAYPPGGAAGNSGNSSGDDLDPAEDKRQKRLMRNRASAQLSRERKKLQLKKLEAQLKALSTTNEQLSSQIAALAQENSALKGRLHTLETTPVQAAFMAGANLPRQYDAGALARQNDGNVNGSGNAVGAGADALCAGSYSPRAKRLRLNDAMARKMMVQAAKAAKSLSERRSSTREHDGSLKRGLMLLAFMFGITVFGTFLAIDGSASIPAGLSGISSVGGNAGNSNTAAEGATSAGAGATVVLMNDEPETNTAASNAAGTRGALQPLAIKSEAAPATAAGSAGAAAGTAAVVRKNDRVLLEKSSLLDSALAKLTEDVDIEAELPPSTTAVASPMSGASTQSVTDALAAMEVSSVNSSTPKTDSRSIASSSPARSPLASSVSSRAEGEVKEKDAAAAIAAARSSVLARLAGAGYRNLNLHTNLSATASTIEALGARGVWNTATGKISPDQSDPEFTTAELLRKGINQVLGLEPAQPEEQQRKADALAAYRALLAGGGNVSFERGVASYFLLNDVIHIPNLNTPNASATGAANRNGSAGAGTASDSEMSAPNSPPLSPPPLQPASPNPNAPAAVAGEKVVSYDRSLTPKRVRTNESEAAPSSTFTSLPTGVTVASGQPQHNGEFAGSTSVGDVLNLWIPTAALRQNVTYDKAEGKPAQLPRRDGVTQVTCSIQSIRPVMLSH